jgi:hypothetical protein
MIGSNSGQVRVTLNHKELQLSFLSSPNVKSVMKVDMSSNFQSDSVTEIKSNFRVEDGEALVP